MLGLIKALRRARKSESIEKKNMWEADALYFIQGMVSVWADDNVLNKEAYAMETLERINDQGKPEVDNRIAENQMMLQNDMAMQEEPVEPQMPSEDVGNIPPVTQREVQLDADKGFV